MEITELIKLYSLTLFPIILLGGGYLTLRKIRSKNNQKKK